tara:strand:- start:1316 stop:1543 length:228 start_codon:yes stop_codon:yes gene_type:complete
MARRGEIKDDDLLYHVTVSNLRRAIADAGFRLVQEDLYVSRFAKRLFPQTITGLLPDVPLMRDILITNMEYVLAT